MGQRWRAGRLGQASRDHAEPKATDYPSNGSGLGPPWTVDGVRRVAPHAQREIFIDGSTALDGALEEIAIVLE
ncbi:MAG: hypothetical protein OHK0013_41360 [Sandaracinaceae bacterium]